MRAIPARWWSLTVYPMTPYQCATGIYDVHKIANGEKMVPREWITKDGTYVTEEFIDYVRPLIQGDSPSVMVDGIPRHLYMGKK